jgi:hypothetical protein
MPRLENKVVLVSGGASGIGAESARLVVREGGKAVLADRDEGKGRALAAELGDAALFVTLDVTQEAGWQSAVAASVERFGGLHGLLNAAGVGVRNSIEDCTLAEYRRVNDINSLGTFLGCKSAIPALKQSGGGSIVNISSVLGLRGASYAMAYCASKGAVRTLTKNADDRAPPRPDRRQPDRPAGSRGAAPARPARPARGGGQHDPVPAVGRIDLLDRLGIRLRRRPDGLAEGNELTHPGDRRAHRPRIALGPAA